MARPEIRQARHEPTGGKGGGRGDPQRRRLIRASQRGDHSGNLAKACLKRLGKAAALWRQGQAATATFDQRQTQMRLKRADLL